LVRRLIGLASKNAILIVEFASAAAASPVVPLREAILVATKLLACGRS